MADTPAGITLKVALNSPVLERATLQTVTDFGNKTTNNIIVGSISISDNSASQNAITLDSPGSLNQSYTLKFPAYQGPAGSQLSNDGQGNLSWVASISQGGVIYKAPVVAATTANITLSGIQTVDGVSLNPGDRVLVKNQTSQRDNGVYVVASSVNWARSPDMLVASDFFSSYVYCVGGTANSGISFLETSVVTAVGTTPVNFVIFNTSQIPSLQSVSGSGSSTTNTLSMGGLILQSAVATNYTSPLRVGNSLTPNGLGDGNLGQILVSRGTGNTPAWSSTTQSDLSTASLSISGTGSNNGLILIGSNNTSFDSQLIVANDINTPTSLSAGTLGQMLISRGQLKTPAWSSSTSIPFTFSNLNVNGRLTLGSATYISPLQAANSLSTPTALSDGTQGQMLISRGSGNTPAWSSTTTADITFPSLNIFGPSSIKGITLTGTSASSYDAPLNAANDATTPTAVNSGTAGQVLVSRGSNKTPAWSLSLGGTTVSSLVSNGRISLGTSGNLSSPLSAAILSNGTYSLSDGIVGNVLVSRGSGLSPEWTRTINNSLLLPFTINYLESTNIVTSSINTNNNSSASIFNSDAVFNDSIGITSVSINNQSRPNYPTFIRTKSANTADVQFSNATISYERNMVAAVNVAANTFTKVNFNYQVYSGNDPYLTWDATNSYFSATFPTGGSILNLKVLLQWTLQFDPNSAGTYYLWANLLPEASGWPTTTIAAAQNCYGMSSSYESGPFFMNGSAVVPLSSLVPHVAIYVYGTSSFSIGATNFTIRLSDGSTGRLSATILSYN